MNSWKSFIAIGCLLMFSVGMSHNVDAQEPLAQQAYLIFEKSCLGCHGPHGAFTEQLIIESAASLIATGAVVPGKPIDSTVYTRLLEKDLTKRMPLGQPQLPTAAILTIGNWIQAGAPDWQPPKRDTDFITPAEMLETIESHLNSLPLFDRAFTRYFTLTHLYNAGERPETLHAYQRALSKLVNSLSWGREVIRPQPIDPEETVFYIDLRDYEWEIGTNRWTLIEQVYPYSIEFDAPTQTRLRAKLTSLRAAMECEVPFVHVDWFIATAALPPLYHDILDLPQTDRALEARLEVNVVENIRNAAGRRVWRAGFNDSGVSNHNRVVERHTSRYGAYWKSYDFAGSVGTQNIFTHPLSFEHDGGEIIFNLPNGLQAYYLADAGGNRLDAAPISIVSNPAASDPTVRNGLSCIGCHTEGMKTFEDRVRSVVEQNANPPYDKARALRLYTAKETMDAFIGEDTARYRAALEATGDVFGGIEPVQRFHEAFQRPLGVSHAAASVGLETADFLEKVREDARLKSLGLGVLTDAGGSVKRDVWTSNFGEIVAMLSSPESRVVKPVVPRTERIPGEFVHIPDTNLRDAIAEALDKGPNAPTAEEMATLTRLIANNRGIQDLTGLEFATNLTVLDIGNNPLSDLSALGSLTKLREIHFGDTEVADLSPLSGLRDLEVIDASQTRISNLAPLAGLANLRKLDTVHSNISDISPLSGLANLTRLRLYDCKVTDISPVRGLTKLTWIGFTHTDTITDFSPLAALTNLKHLDLFRTGIADLSVLTGLTNLETLILEQNEVVDVSPLTSLRNLKELTLHANNILDVSPLDDLRKSLVVFTWYQNPGFPQGGPKIQGPWQWLMLPVQAEGWGGIGLLTDYLAAASEGEVTEQQIATLGASDGDVVGNSVWSVGTLEPYNFSNLQRNENNVRRLLDPQGAIEDPLDFHYPKQDLELVVYGSVTLYAPRTQQTRIFVGASLGRKVWLNGQLVHQEYIIDRGNPDYQTSFPVTLKKGKNVVLVAAEYWHSRWSLFFGFEPGTEYTVLNPRISYTFSEDTIHAGDTFTLDINAEDIHDFAGWQFDVVFDPAGLEAVEVNEGDFLKTDGATTFFQKGRILNATGKIAGLGSARLSEDGVSGTGTLLSVVFSAKSAGEMQLHLENFQLADIEGELISAGPHEALIRVAGQLAIGDVNRDGFVSILDMVIVARHFGKNAAANPAADINGDGVISILDLILVSQQMGKSAAAPSMLVMEDIEGLDPTMIQAWIKRAQIEDDGSIAFQQGIAYLQSLLDVLIPEEMALLPNYPNPFNPETWIPYQLSEPAVVTLNIYSVNGVLVRTLVLGHIPAGIYQSRSRAAYWDGKNDVGESVASGVYFYTLTAGDFTATRKLLIRK